MLIQHLRRQHLLGQPFPPKWEALLLQNVALYQRLNEEEKSRLRQNTRILVAEKNWEGCRGLHVTEEMQVTIAAQASLLLLGIEHDYYSRVQSILIYPSSFLVCDDEEHETSQVLEGASGQAVYRGPVILAWDQVFEEGRNLALGSNLVIHEFAHQLDFLDGYINGTPVLGTTEQARRWHKVMTRAYNGLSRDLAQGRDTFLGEYAASNESEFFAVVSERFFTLPNELRDHHPELYGILAEYYRLEPVRWFPSKW